MCAKLSAPVRASRRDEMIVARRFIAGKTCHSCLLVPLGTTDQLKPALTPSAVPMGLDGLYWSCILDPAMNRRATLRGSYGTITAVKLTPMGGAGPLAWSQHAS